MPPPSSADPTLPASTPWWRGLRGMRRRLVHATLYEAIAVVVVTVGFMLLADTSTGRAAGLAVASSVIAMLWNMAYNALFERWEARQAQRARTLRRRIMHSIGFELGLILWLVPLIAWWLDMSLGQALLADLALVLFFLFYTLAFNWAFDRIFGLPWSIMHRPDDAGTPAAPAAENKTGV